MALVITEGERKAISKANKLNGAQLVERVHLGVYLVPSATEDGVVWTVTGTAIDASDHQCSCPAGLNGKPCWHSAAVRLRRVQEEAKRQWRAIQRRRATEAPANVLPFRRAA